MALPEVIRLPRVEAGEAAQSPARFYEEHAPYVRELVGRLLGRGADPEDVTQEVFLRAWRKRAQIRPESMRAWLHGAAIRLALLERRKLWFCRVLGLSAAGPMPDFHTPEDDLEAAEARRLVYAALEKLSEKRRTVFILFELQGLSGAEIAAALNCPVKTVRTRLFHARRDFEAALRETQAARACCAAAPDVSRCAAGGFRG